MAQLMPTPLAIFVHGFNVPDGGQATVGRLDQFFNVRGYDTVLFKMGWMGLVQVYLQNDKHAQRLAETCLNAKLDGRKVVLIGHSNGAAVIHRATTEYEAPADHVVYINPALDRESAPGKQVPSFDVWYSPSDFPVKVSRFLPWSPWGDMGAKGYTGPDPRATNFNLRDGFEVSVKGHSEYAEGEKLAFFGPTISQRTIYATNHSRAGYPVSV